MAERPGGDPKDTRPPLTIDLAPDAPSSPGSDTPLDGLAMPAASAAVGGVLGLTLALIFAGLGVWPSAAPTGGDPAEISKLRTDLAAARAETEALSARLGELAARPQPGAPADARVSGLVDRLAAQEKALAALQARPSAPTEAGQPIPDPRLEQFGADLAALRQAIQPADGLAERLTKLEAAHAELTSAVAVARPLAQSVSTLDGRFGQLEATTTDLQRQTAVLEGRLAEASAKVNGAVTARSDAVLALTLATLKTAVDSGRPFGAELAVATRLAPGATLAPLAPLAVTGVAPLSRLAEVFPALARRIGEAELARRVSGGSMVDKLMAQAKQSVSIRPLDEASGPSVPARLARIEAALNAGRTAEALADWQSLPEAARALDPQFDAQLSARTRVDALLSTTTRTALDRLAGGAP